MSVALGCCWPLAKNAVRRLSAISAASSSALVVFLFTTSAWMSEGSSETIVLQRSYLLWRISQRLFLLSVFSALLLYLNLTTPVAHPPCRPFFWLSHLSSNLSGRKAPRWFMYYLSILLRLLEPRYWDTDNLSFHLSVYILELRNERPQQTHRLVTVDGVLRGTMVGKPLGVCPGCALETPGWHPVAPLKTST